MNSNAACIQKLNKSQTFVKEGSMKMVAQFRISSGYRGTVSTGAKRPGRGADDSPPFNAEVTPCFHGIVLKQ
jgi:hypothetical protein